ncbi:MAG: hypothetical protein ACFFD1_16085 [Candidatus Thorarchaeota archaeon]
MKIPNIHFKHDDQKQKKMAGLIEVREERFSSCRFKSAVVESGKTRDLKSLGSNPVQVRVLFRAS